MTKKYLFLYSLLIIGKGVFAQNVSIKGKVHNEMGDLLPFVNIILLQPSDSTIVQATVTDTTGTYRFGENIPESFILKGQYIGYETYYSEVIYLADETGNKIF